MRGIGILRCPRFLYRTCALGRFWAGSCRLLRLRAGICLIIVVGVSYSLRIVGGWCSRSWYRVCWASRLTSSRFSCLPSWWLVGMEPCRSRTRTCWNCNLLLLLADGLSSPYCLSTASSSQYEWRRNTLCICKVRLVDFLTFLSGIDISCRLVHSPSSLTRFSDRFVIRGLRKCLNSRLRPSSQLCFSRTWITLLFWALLRRTGHGQILLYSLVSEGIPRRYCFPWRTSLLRWMDIS